VIKAVRELTQLGLKEGKDLVDAAPKACAGERQQADAEKAVARLKEAGATADMKVAATKGRDVRAGLGPLFWI